jgi:hypothetical protein
MFTRRQSHGRGRRQRRAAAGLVALAAALMFTAQWPGPAAHASDSTPRLHAASSSHPGWVRYYIVQPLRDHHSEDLYEIAVKTLGNGSRATTIFKLNRGRLQRGGGRLQDPSVIKPGWILVLPRTASGPGVRFGPLPGLTAPAAVSPQPLSSSQAADGTATAGQPWYLVSKRAAVVVGVILIALLLAAGLAVGLAAAGGLRRNPRVTRPPHGRYALAPLAAGPPAESTLSGLSALDTTGFPALRMPDQPGGRLALTAPTAIFGPASPSWPDYPLSAAARPDGPGQPERSDPGLPAQDHEVVFGDDRIRVVLAEGPAATRAGQPHNGHTGFRPAPYLLWTPRPGDTPDGGVAFACLGTGAAGALFIDIGAAPGAVAIGGDDDAAVRLAESIAHQLCAAPAADRGCAVVVIGDTLPAPPPSAATWVASVRELAGPAWPPHFSGNGTEVIFCRSSPKADMIWLARYVSRARHRVIPVVLARIPEVPWSFTAQPSRHPDNSLQSVIA